MAFLTLSPTERYKSVTVKVTTTGNCGSLDAWAMYAATANIPPPKLRRIRASAPARAVVNRPFSYKISAKNMGESAGE